MNRTDMGTTGHYRIGVCLFLLVVAVTLCIVAGFRFAAAILATPGDPVIAVLDEQGSVTETALRTLISARAAARDWSANPRYSNDIGRAARVLALRLREDGARAHSELRAAERATVQALTAAPVDPNAWLRLAAIQMDLGAEPQAVLSSLRSSVRSGGFDRWRTLIRVRMVLRLWRYLEEDDRLLFRNQFRYLWAQDPETLAELTLDSRVFLITIAMLGDDEAVNTLRAMRHQIMESRE